MMHTLKRGHRCSSGPGLRIKFLLCGPFGCHPKNPDAGTIISASVKPSNGDRVDAVFYHPLTTDLPFADSISQLGGGIGCPLSLSAGHLQTHRGNSKKPFNHSMVTAWNLFWVEGISVVWSGVSSMKDSYSGRRRAVAIFY